MSDETAEEKWQKFVTAAFKAAELPEIPENELEPGTYTNAQIAKKFREHPTRLLDLLMKVSKVSGSAEKRSILSFSVDLL